ncbi:Signal transduction histidine kinase [Halobacillus karajensis]|uniref:sensor histidine kinase n=1 Tax=Halobacillus karajensis TaxID=195088 RepID=UPI0008A72869|nr:HAMP domain-containing sensor histidine kinase [Halobacillus karajensis]SEH40766.1 Signal transduction histidine kinase [Halobacillus karajensis]
MKLGNRIQFYTTGLFIFLLLLISSAVYFSFSKIVYDSDLQETQQEAERIVTEINERSEDAPSAELLRAYVPGNGMIRVVLQDGTADVNLTGGGQQYLTDQTYHYEEREKADVRSYQGVPHAFVSIPIIWTNGNIAALQLTQSLETTEDNLSILQIVLVIVTILAIVPLFLSAHFLSKLIANPIRSLIVTMQEIRGSGQFKQITYEGNSKDELSQMADTFNKMIVQLEDNYQKQEQFVSNASHELKTPLTVIESYASLLKRRGTQDEELFQESVEAIHSEAKRMRELTQQLLLLAKQEEKWNVYLESIALSPFLNTTVASFEHAYHRQVDWEGIKEIQVQTDEQKLKQLLYIFMDNARKYSEGPIIIKVDETEDKARIHITDKGMGMTEEELDKVFDRFYQVDQSRTEGSGLGLSLAKELAQAIGAEITLSSQKGKGTTASILLPLSGNSHFWKV